MKSIPDYEGLYGISADGQVYSNRRNRFLKPKIDKYGYKVVALSKNGNRLHRTVHRLVALTYLSNPLNLPCVNHKNENKLDNRVENLEWCTVKYNDNHGTRNMRMAKSKCKRPIVCCTADGKTIIYDGVKDASRKTGIAHSQISKHCMDGLATSDGSKWRYVNETN